MYEVEKSDSVGDETVETTLSYVKGTEDMSTVFEMRDSNDRTEQLIKRLEVYTDSDWTSDQVTRKSTSGAVIMAEGMRLHAHSRGQAFSGIEQFRSRGDGSLGRHQGGTVVARSVDVCWFGTLKLKAKWIAARHTHSSIDEVLGACSK